jgi:hypothetical protein
MRTAVAPGRSQITSFIAPMLALSLTVTAPISRAERHPVAERRHLLRALVPDRHAGVDHAVGADRQAGVNQPPAGVVNPQPGAMLVEAGISMLAPACASMQYAGYKRQQHQPGRAPARPARDDRRRSPAGGVEARRSGGPPAAPISLSVVHSRDGAHQAPARGRGLRDAPRRPIRASWRSSASRTVADIWCTDLHQRGLTRERVAAARGTSSDRGWPPGPVRGRRLTSG